MLIRSPLRLAAKTLAVLIVAYPGFVVSLTVARLGAYAHGCNGRGSDFVCHSMSPTAPDPIVLALDVLIWFATLFAIAVIIRRSKSDRSLS